MYKNIFLLSFIVYLFISCNEKIPKNDIQTLGLKGVVKSVEEEFYFATYSFDKVILNKKLYERFYQFDTIGRLTEYMHLNIFLAQQPDSKQLVLDTLFCTPSDTISHSDSLFMNENNIFKKNNSNLNEPDYIRREFSYINDSVYIVNNFDKQGKLLFYDDCRLTNTQLNYIKTFDNTDKLLSKTEYIYDKKGRTINKTKYYEKISYKTQFKYHLGKKYESYSYIAKHYVYFFNCKRLIRKQKNYIGKTFLSTVYYKYDEMNNIISKKETDNLTDSLVVTKESIYSYKYDKYGNWIEKLEKRYDGNLFVTVRLVDYY